MFNPVKASKNIKDEFINYVETSFSFADKSLREQFIQELDKMIAAGPYLEVNDVFQSGKSIEQLIEEGVLSPLFRRLEEKRNCLRKTKEFYLLKDHCICIRKKPLERLYAVKMLLCPPVQEAAKRIVF